MEFWCLFPSFISSFLMDLPLGTTLLSSDCYISFPSKNNPRTPLLLVTIPGKREGQDPCSPGISRQRIMVSHRDEPTYLKKVYWCPYIQGWRVKAGKSPNGGTTMESIRAKSTKVAGRTICRKVATEARAEVRDDTHAQEGIQGTYVYPYRAHTRQARSFKPLFLFHNPMLVVKDRLLGERYRKYKR